MHIYVVKRETGGTELVLGVCGTRAEARKCVKVVPAGLRRLVYVDCIDLPVSKAEVVRVLNDLLRDTPDKHLPGKRVASWTVSPRGGLKEAVDA